MTTPLSTVLTATAAISAGMTGGVYLAFSAIVMPSLRNQPATAAITTMRGINQMAVKAPFMTIFFGGAAAAAAVIATQIDGGDSVRFDPVRTVGAALALAGFVVTMAFNVPRNNALAKTTMDHAATEWHRFEHGWIRANHLRGALAVVGSVVLTASLMQ